MPRRSSPSTLINQPLLVIIIPIIALLLIFLFLIPPSFSSHKLRPTSVKKSWDSLNIFLVLFAILFGVFARKNDEDSSPADVNHDTYRNNTTTGEIPLLNTGQSPVSSNQSWFDRFSDRKIYGTPPFETPAAAGGRLRRSSSSYPDLRQESLWDHQENDGFRFFDDFEISKYASSEYNNIRHRSRRSSRFEESSNIKEIPVDTFALRSSVSPSPMKSPSQAPTTPPPPPPPLPRTNHKERRTYKTEPRKEKSTREEVGGEDKIQIPPPPPPPPTPPPQAVAKATLSEKYRKGERKKINTKEIKMVWASIYNPRKRKTKLKTKTSFDDSLHFPPEPTSFTRPPPSPPPPPPPPPPPSMFYSLFRKGSKSKKVHSFSAPVPPPPPPPPPSSSVFTPKKWSRRKNQVPPPPPPPPRAPPTPPPESSRRQHSGSARRPPLPTRVDNFYDENVNSGGQSPLIPMPPPPPPFKVQGFRFVLSGDFVKIRSASSSRCSSPELEEVEKSATEAVGGTNGGGGGSVFCPSPDVNVKADSFIARLRDEWKLEKINSIKAKRSNGLDPSPDPLTGPSTR